MFYAHILFISVLSTQSLLAQDLWYKNTPSLSQESITQQKEKLERNGDHQTRQSQIYVIEKQKIENQIEERRQRELNQPSHGWDKITEETEKLLKKFGLFNEKEETDLD